MMLMKWPLGNDCSGAVPNEDAQAASFTVATAGTYKLCYRANGMSDSVEQTGVTLAVGGTATSAEDAQAATISSVGRPAHKTPASLSL